MLRVKERATESTHYGKFISEKYTLVKNVKKPSKNTKIWDVPFLLSYLPPMSDFGQ